MDPQLDPVRRDADNNRRIFEEFCRSLSDEEAAALVPGSHWRVKDYIAHLASIDMYVGDWFAHVADGRRWDPTASQSADGSPFNIDTWNDARIQERRDLGIEDLLGEAARERERLWGTVDRFTPEVLAQRFDFRGRDISFLRYLKLWTGHDPAHSYEMLQALPSRAGDAGLQSWTAPFAPVR